MSRLEMLCAPPEGVDWFSRLRWLLRVMNDEDTSLRFTSSVLAYGMKNSELTPSQLSKVDAIYRRVLADYEDEVLDYQSLSRK